MSEAVCNTPKAMQNEGITGAKMSTENGLCNFRNKLEARREGIQQRSREAGERLAKGLIEGKMPPKESAAEESWRDDGERIWKDFDHGTPWQRFKAACQILLALGLVIGLVIALAMPKDPEQVRKEICTGDDGRFAALSRAETLVEQSLKAPSTASFAPASERAKVTTPGPDCTWTARGWVDAQNSFGAKIRSNYRVIVQARPDAKTGEWGWYRLSVDVN